MKELRYNTRIKVGDEVTFSCNHMEFVEDKFPKFKDEIFTTLCEGIITEIYTLPDYKDKVKYTGSKLNQNKHFFVLIRNNHEYTIISHIGNLKK